MDTRNYHAHMRIRICIENNQSGSGCVPVQQTATRYHKIGLVDKRRLIMYISWNIANQSRMADKSTNRSINQSIIKSRMWGPHQSPIYLARISLTNSIILELWKLHSCLCKINRNKRLFETRKELKLLERKLDFRNLFEDWSLEDCLIIGVSKIIWKLNLRIGILEIKWRWKVEIKFGS